MTSMIPAFVLGMPFLVVAPEAADDEVTLANVPPVVVETVPKAGADDVDPALEEVRVTFSKAMMPGGWSWATHTKESFPETTGDAKYLDDERTCVLPVRLAPGTTYAIWINSAKFGNFQDADGRPALPYLLVFKTRD